MNLKARSAVWRLWLSTLGGLFLLGCAQTGRIYVSTPQINTRERLVARRLEESEWLKRQLTNSDTITTTFQGVEDFRQFAGFYAQVRAAFDPSQGALSAGTQNNQLLAQETEQWQLKKLNLEAKNDYLRALSSTNTATATNSNTPDSTPPNTNPAPSAPGLPSPPSDSFSNPPALPSPTNTVETQAKAGLLDLLHDKMAYRTEVISAIKSVELDDSHDLAGMMLYDLNFSVTIVPGDNLQRLAQVKISLQDQNEPGQLPRRVPELRRFFSVWKDELQAEIIRDAAGLQHRFTNRQLNQNDQNFIRWFLVTQLPVLRSQLEQEHELLKGLQQISPSWTNLLKVAAQHRLFYLFTPAMVKSREQAPARGEELQNAAGRVHSMLEAVEKLESAAASANSREVLALLTNDSGSTVSLDHPGGRLVLETIPWAVWSKYHDTLGRFVVIEAPQTTFASTNVGPRLSGLKVTELAILSSHGNDKADDRSQAAMAFGDDKVQVDASTGVSDTGELTFVNRLLEREKAAYAASVEPKEYAQNISEVSARERMLNLIGAMQAAFPAAGVNAEAQMQYLRRRQDLLHGIERRPLAAGFGMGSADFGWILGPKFDIEKGKKQFKHTTLRHDFSAGIVIPAWHDRVHLTGEFAWINEDGSVGPATPLWTNKSGINRSVPLPRDAFRRITQALVANRPADEAFLFTSRPYPIVSEPSWDKQLLVGTNTGPFTMVIRGRELWRNPQVFLGTQQAQSVRVLSDMDGLIAEFTTPLDQQVSSYALKVVTTFGEYNVPAAVVRPPPVK